MVLLLTLNEAAGGGLSERQARKLNEVMREACQAVRSDVLGYPCYWSPGPGLEPGSATISDNRYAVRSGSCVMPCCLQAGGLQQPVRGVGGRQLPPYRVVGCFCITNR